MLRLIALVLGILILATLASAMGIFGKNCQEQTIEDLKETKKLAE